MPRLPHDTTIGGSSDHDTALEGQPTPTLEPSPPLAMDHSVKYIPSQMDPLAGATVRAARQGPIRLMIKDAVVLLRLWRFIPNLLIPFCTQDEGAELYWSWPNMIVGFQQILLALIQFLSVVMVIPAFVSLPGGVFVAATAICCLTCHLITLPMQGPPINSPNMDEFTKALAEQHKNEHWVFVNGICTGHWTSQLEIDRLSKLFGRAVFGIHNKSYGIFADLGMCLVQRACLYQDYGTRLTYAHVKARLVNPTITKVVLIGHSQGGIIVSQVIDDLLSQLPVRTMSKLEVYTFGSAASHFSNPFLTLRSNASANQPNEKRSLKMSQSKLANASQGNHVIPYMEHYANEHDLVPRWGVLHSVQDVLNARYAGSIFVRLGASGHMFNQHYLDPMFPLLEHSKHTTEKGKGVKRKFWGWGKAAVHDKDPIGDRLDKRFLDRIVTTDERLATQRDTTMLEEIGIMRRESGLEFGNGQVLKNFEDANGDEFMTFLRTASDRVFFEEARDKTVKDLSRFWKYLGGKSPMDHAGNGADYPDPDEPPHE